MSDPLHAARVPEEFSAADAHLVAVSGGRDSMALLHWLGAAGFRRLVVCHVDHGLRPESAEDAHFVENAARGAGLEFRGFTADARAFARERKLSLEAAARELRYAFFGRVAAELDCPRLFLAHHADDQVETFLLQLLRGAGPAGLGGMAPLGARAVEGVGLRLARPLLGVWRAEIDAYIKQHRLAYREDTTNAEFEHTRNRIRHLALPALAGAFGRDPREALWRAAELLRAEDALLAAAPELQELPRELPVPWLRALPLALQRRVLHRWMKEGGIEGAGFAEVEAARALLAGGAGPAKANLPGGRCVRRREKRLLLDAQGN